MKFNWDKILLIIMLIFSIGLFYSSNVINNNRNIDDIKISILPKSQYFISSDSILKVIDPNLNEIKGSKVLFSLEKIIDSISYVEKSQISKTVGGNLNIEIKQNKPIARIITDDSMFYLSENLTFMNLSKLQSVKVPLIIGYEKKSSLKFLAKISFITQNDNFLNERISKIIIDKQDNLSVKFRGLDTNIFLGKDIRINEKIKNLKGFYKRLEEKKELLKYREINLQFENQIVAIKNQIL